VKGIAPVPFRGGIAEARLERVADLPNVPGIIQGGGLGGVVADIVARHGVQPPVAHVQFPSLDLLKQSHRDEVLVIAGRAIPAIQRVPIDAQPRPAKVLPQQQLRLDRRRTLPGGEGEVLVIRPRQHRPGAERQGRHPGRLPRRGLVEDLVADAKGPVHQPGGGIGMFVGRELAPADGGGAHAQIGRPPFGNAILRGQVALVDINAVFLAVRAGRDIVLPAPRPDVVGLGFLIHQPDHKLAPLRHVGPLRKRPVRHVFGSPQPRRQRQDAQDHSQPQGRAPNPPPANRKTELAIAHHKCLPGLCRNPRPGAILETARVGARARKPACLAPAGRE